MPKKITITHHHYKVLKCSSDALLRVMKIGASSKYSKPLLNGDKTIGPKDSAEIKNIITSVRLYMQEMESEFDQYGS